VYLSVQSRILTVAHHDIAYGTALKLYYCHSSIFYFDIRVV